MDIFVIQTISYVKENVDTQWTRPQLAEAKDYEEIC